VIEVRNLCKYFGGRPAVKGITFDVEKGQILGFLGPNGAGKTTTMRILTCYMPPDAGTARVGGFDVFEHSIEVRRRIGYLPETPPLYGEMVVRGYLDFVARIRGLSGTTRRTSVDAAMERCGLAQAADRLIGNLSKGFRQRVGLAQAILHDPPVLILDEPTAGLDPEQIIEIRELIKALGDDHTIIISTHILPEVTVTCTQVAIISYGEIVEMGSLAGLAGARSGDTERIRIRLARGCDDAGSLLGEVEGVLAVRPAGEEGVLLIEARSGEQVREALAAAAVGRGWGLLEMTPVTRSLEEIYLQATRRIQREEPSAGADDGGAVSPPAAEARRAGVGAVGGGGAP
jgi:ABC-2 type transport system ATP-binding protein